MTKTKVNIHSNEIFIKATEVAEIMDVSRAYAYRIINRLNGELEKEGYLTLSGKTNRQYFYERIGIEAVITGVGA